ncbi:MAG: hypothetical protein JO003_09880 [Candidatus Eremiobacteraeota bacterium]|nr:hypothetical protein [Candidatus Eremiobacteraeota bacterium]
MTRALAVVLVTVAVGIAPVRAERPIVDLHRLDAYFELFAADSSVPWKPTTVRLDTYSSAPVAFSVYRVDPADVLTAGSNLRSRAILTAGRHPLLSFNFTPPGGYQFESSEVNLPLGAREGFFVVEARRGDVGEQVWINRTRIGIVSKETPSGLLVYGADLGTGGPLARMRVAFVVNRTFATSVTNADGIVTWNRWPRPVFALAQWGDSYAFLSLLPQAPLPETIVGVRTDSAVVHAGDAVRVVGFARTRSRGILKASSGSALVTLRDGARQIAEHRVALDDAGAFTTSFAIPQNAAAGDYTVLAQADRGVGGATVHVDANAGGLTLRVVSACGGGCDWSQDVPLLIHASSGGATVRVTVMRSPHVYLGYAGDEEPWATTRWLDTALATDQNGNATVKIPRPSDDLASTYGVHVEAGGATADTRVEVPTAQAAIRLHLDHAEQGLGMPVNFDVYAQSLDGKPLAGAEVDVRMAHGASVAQQLVRLDADGHARGSFSSPELGTNLIVASVDHGGRATDAAQVQIDPQAPAATSDGTSGNVRLALDRTSYRAGDDVTVDASAPGSQGDALVTFESALGVQTHVLRTSGGRAVTRLRAADAAGDLRIGAAFVRDGAIEWSTVPLALAAPGRPQSSHVALTNAEFAPGQATRIALDGEAAQRGTIVVRISRGAPSGSAIFSSAPALLAVGVTTTQSSAPESLTWHPWVNSTGDHAQVLSFVRRSEPPAEASLAQADTEAVGWSVGRAGADGIGVALPESSGRYTLSVLDIFDDGSVSEASSTVVVR